MLEKRCLARRSSKLCFISRTHSSIHVLALFREKVSKAQLTGQSWPTACFGMSHKLRILIHLHFFNGWGGKKKQKKNMGWHVRFIWNSNFSVYHKFYWIGHTRSFTRHLWPHLQQQSWEATTEAITKLKIFITWPFAEKVATLYFRAQMWVLNASIYTLTCVNIIHLLRDTYYITTLYSLSFHICKMGFIIVPTLWGPCVL